MEHQQNSAISHFLIYLKDIKIVIDDNTLKVNRFTPGKIFNKNFDYLKNKNKYQVIIILA